MKAKLKHRPRQLSGATSQLLVFIVVGALSTLVFFATYNPLRLLRVDALAANGIALFSSTAFGFAANRQVTFKVRGWRGWFSQFVQFAAVLGVTFGITSAALKILFATRPEASRLEENLVLIVSSGALSLARFWVLRQWVFRAER